MKRWKAAAGFAALVLLVFVARTGVDPTRIDPSDGGDEVPPAASHHARAPDDRHRLPAPASGNAAVALPATRGRDPGPLRLTRGMLEQAWQRGKLDVVLPNGHRYDVDLEGQRFDPGGQWTVTGHAQTRLGPQAMVLTFGPDAVFGVLPGPDGSLMQVTTTHGATEIAAAGGMLPPGRKNRLGARPDYAIPAMTAGGDTRRTAGAAPV